MRPRLRSAGEPLHILVIDDLIDLADSLADVLHFTITDVTVDVAYGGREGTASAATGRYDVVITDLAMPSMDGFQVGAAVKADSVDTPVLIAVSGNQNLVEVARSGATFDHAMLKPIDTTALVALLERA